jgi:LPPG:FO 2-phospho-L-lactate transferase
MPSPVVILAGGTGGAKLARGMLDVAGDDLVVIANTGDDIEIHGGYVSPDPDLVTFWLADRIDERGWGIADDTFAVMDGLRALGDEVWFNLGDRDLAIALHRARALPPAPRSPRLTPGSPPPSESPPRSCRCAINRSAPGCSPAASGIRCRSS